uniref:SRPBCC family protein n=1 Tax=Crossiella equi TaxID=130796 RepID=UPI00117762B2
TGALTVTPPPRTDTAGEVTVNAPVHTVWRLMTDVNRWPTWQAPVLAAKRLDHGPLRPGSVFQWSTPAPETELNPATTLHITSTVHHVRRDNCLRWSGPAVGEGLRVDNGVHVWNFTPVRGGVRVRTEETWTGAQVEQNVPLATEFLGMGLRAWLGELKTAAERCDR